MQFSFYPQALWQLMGPDKVKISFEQNRLLFEMIDPRVIGFSAAVESIWNELGPASETLLRDSSLIDAVLLPAPKGGVVMEYRIRVEKNGDLLEELKALSRSAVDRQLDRSDFLVIPKHEGIAKKLLKAARSGSHASSPVSQAKLLPNPTRVNRLPKHENTLVRICQVTIPGQGTLTAEIEHAGDKYDLLVRMSCVESSAKEFLFMFDGVLTGIELYI